jgi:hypothetical protein
MRSSLGPITGTTATNACALATVMEPWNMYRKLVALITAALLLGLFVP